MAGEVGPWCEVEGVLIQQTRKLYSTLEGLFSISRDYLDYHRCLYEEVAKIRLQITPWSPCQRTCGRTV